MESDADGVSMQSEQLLEDMLNEEVSYQCEMWKSGRRKPSSLITSAPPPKRFRSEPCEDLPAVRMSKDPIAAFIPGTVAPGIGMLASVGTPLVLSKKRPFDGDDPYPYKVPKLNTSGEEAGNPVNGLLASVESDDALKPYYVKSEQDLGKVEIFLPPLKLFAANSIEESDPLASEYRVTLKLEENYGQYQKLPISIPEDLVSNLFKQSDNTFKSLMERFGCNIGAQNLANIVDFMITNNVVLPGTNHPKVQAIVEHALLPQMAHRGFRMFQNIVTPTFRKLLNFDEEAVLDSLVVAMLYKGLIIRTIPDDVDMTKVFRKIIYVMHKHKTDFVDTTRAAFNFVLDKTDWISYPYTSWLFDVLRVAAGHEMNEQLASTYLAVMRRFLPLMTENDAIAYHSLNAYNKSAGKTLIDKLAYEKLFLCRREESATKYQICVWNPPNENGNYLTFVPNGITSTGNAAPSGDESVDVDMEDVEA